MYKYAVVSDKMQFSFVWVFKQLLCIASWTLVKIVLCIQVFAISMQSNKKIKHLMQTIIMNKSKKMVKKY